MISSGTSSSVAAGTASVCGACGDSVTVVMSGFSLSGRLRLRAAASAVNRTERVLLAQIRQLPFLLRRALWRRLELLAADVGLAVGHQPGQRLVQRLQRGVPRLIAEHVPGPGDARGDAAEGVLAGGLGVPGIGLPVELGPVDEL